MTSSGTFDPSTNHDEQACAWCLRLAEGSLPLKVREEFNAWLSSDPENARAFEDAARVWQSFEHSHHSPELIDLRRDALEVFRRRQETRWRRSLVSRRQFVGVAAALAMAAIAIGMWMRFVPDRYSTGLGERRIVALSDGSRISLDAQSRVDVRYSKGLRQLQLRQGRAKFSVAKDPLRPFSVSAADKTVVATGTEFSVELLSNQVHVILYQGRIEVLEQRGGELRSIGRETPSAIQAMAPSTELVAGIASPALRLRSIDPGPSLAWENGQVAFDAELLASAVERVNRYTDEPLAIGAPEVGRIRISGTFLAGDTAAFVEGVTAVFPVDVEERDGRPTLVPARH